MDKQTDYGKLYNSNEIGRAKSIECYSENKLVGGLYGILMGNFFCGESMFSLQKNSSKVTLFIWLLT